MIETQFSWVDTDNSNNHSPGDRGRDHLQTITTIHSLDLLCPAHIQLGALMRDQLRTSLYKAQFCPTENGLCENPLHGIHSHICDIFKTFKIF